MNQNRGRTFRRATDRALALGIAGMMLIAWVVVIRFFQTANWSAFAVALAGALCLTASSARMTQLALKHWGSR